MSPFGAFGPFDLFGPFATRLGPFQLTLQITACCSSVFTDCFTHYRDGRTDSHSLAPSKKCIKRIKFLQSAVYTAPSISLLLHWLNGRLATSMVPLFVGPVALWAVPLYAAWHSALLFIGIVAASCQWGSRSVFSNPAETNIFFTNACSIVFLACSTGPVTTTHTTWPFANRCSQP